MELQKESQNLIEKHELLETLDNSNKLILRNLSFRENFKMGIYRGLGATVGLAIIFALASFIIKNLGGLPLIGNWLIHWGSYIHR